MFFVYLWNPMLRSMDRYGSYRESADAIQRAWFELAKVRKNQPFYAIIQCNGRDVWDSRTAKQA